MSGNKLACGVHLQVIKANDDLTPEHYQFFLYQMLRGMKYIHSGTCRVAGRHPTHCWAA